MKTVRPVSCWVWREFAEDCRGPGDGRKCPAEADFVLPGIVESDELRRACDRRIQADRDEMPGRDVIGLMTISHEELSPIELRCDINEIASDS